MALVLLAIPVGLLFLFWERRTDRENRRKAADYLAGLKNAVLPHEEKLRRIAAFYQNSGFAVRMAHGAVQAARKRFSIGWLLIGFGFFVVGALVYLLIYVLRKPATETIEV